MSLEIELVNGKWQLCFLKSNMNMEVCHQLIMHVGMHKCVIKLDCTCIVTVSYARSQQNVLIMQKV